MKKPNPNINHEKTMEVHEKTMEVFLRLRRGMGFVYLLTGFLIIWFGLRAILSFDADYSLLNLILSIEASVATALLLDLQYRQQTQTEDMFGITDAMITKLDRLEVNKLNLIIKRLNQIVETKTENTED